MREKASQAGFEYYLDRLQKEKETARREAPIELLRILARDDNGLMRLLELTAQYLPYDAPESEIVDFMDIVKSMVKAELISMYVEGDQESEETENIMVKLTPIGRKMVEASSVL